MKKDPDHYSTDSAEIEALITRLERGQLRDEDAQLLARLLRLLLLLITLIQQKNASLSRLKWLLFGPSSYSTAAMLESEVKVKVLALDLEGTLISNAVSQIARPGLFDFLEDCRKLFPRNVIFTSVNEERFRSIANLLTTEGYAPNWFADIEYITWSGETKNLIFLDGASPEEILLVDDYEKYVHPRQ